jgi:predicted nucleic-acid-binding Zn-ribbon protein
MLLSEKDSFNLCPRCGGNFVHAKLQGPGIHNRIFLHIHNETSPYESKAFFLVAWVCSTCGYVELHTDLSETMCD